MRNVLLTVALVSLLWGCGGGTSGPQRATDTAPGAPATAKTAALETGANLLQSKAPVEKISMYLDGFHVSKDDPALQMEAHHYCNQVNEDFAQCVLFDGNTGDARLMGIEYIISNGTRAVPRALVLEPGEHVRGRVPHHRRGVMLFR